MISIKEDKLKESFQRIKEDMFFLKGEIDTFKTFQEEIIELKNFNKGLRNEIINLCEVLKQLSKKIEGFDKNASKNKDSSSLIPFSLEFFTSTHNNLRQTDRQTEPTQTTNQTDTSTDLLPLESLNRQNIPFSTGNQGVSTDRQTDQQTNRQTNIPLFNPTMTSKKENLVTTKQITLNNTSEILEGLDNIKRELRLKFKGLTDQEMLVFSTIYQLEEEITHVDYKILSEKLSLSESSIRDYIGRLLKKGIPLEKAKVNNKSIVISISPNLKKIASLSTILKLKEL